MEQVERQILSIKETVERAKERGLDITEYSLRRLLRTNRIPHQHIGTKYLIYWPNVERYLMATDVKATLEEDRKPKPSKAKPYPAVGNLRRIDW
jgi:hypothetical protein